MKMKKKVAIKINFDYEKEWLYQFKLSLHYTYNDKDTQLISFLKIAHENVLTQYMQLKVETINDPENLEFITQEKVQYATYKLATDYFENPDSSKVVDGNVTNERQIYAILGDLVNYAI